MAAEDETAPLQPAAEDTGGASVFKDVHFHIITSQKLSSKLAEELTKILVDNGATICPPRGAIGTSKITIDLEIVTHVIAADTDFPGYTEAERLMIPVVKPEWVHASMGKNRAAQVRPFSPDPRFFFSGVIASMADLPPGDKEAICGGIIAMGGQCTHSLTKFTTHVVTLDMDNDKCRQALAKKLKVKIVLPHWFDDCLKLERRIDEAPYQFPSPDIERLDANAPLDMPRPDLAYTHAHENGAMMKGPPSLPENGLNIFNRKRLKFCDDLRLGDRILRLLGELVGRANGSVTSQMEDADILVCYWREGDDYVQACRRELYVGNLTWLYWMLAHREWASPLARLLHYPVVRGGLPEMQSMVVTVSNYGGDARLYLESLIDACGARFTKSMRYDNTHLITARAHSEKVAAAREWNIHTVNHLWLEDSYAKWQVQTLSNPRYTHFPRRTNLMEIVGQTPIDRDVLPQFYQEDGSEVDNVGSGATIINLPEGVGVNQRLKDVNGGKAAATPKPGKNSNITRDTRIPLSSGGRKAKEQAAARLHDQIMPDVILFQREQKRKGGVVGGSKKRPYSGSGSEASQRPTKRRTLSPESSSAEELATAKKVKKRPKPTVRLLITAYRAWLDESGKEDREKKVLGEIGIKCVTDPLQCTHLAAPHLIRTEKFCCALARAPIVVSTAWIDACVHERAIVSTTDFELKDPEGEKRLGISLPLSLSRAKANQGKLLRGQTIYCTSGVHGGFDVCKRVVEANGGVCILLKTPKRPANAPDSEKMVLLSASDPAEHKWWAMFEKMAQASGKKCWIFKGDWLLDLAMKQEIDWEGTHSLR